MTAWVRVGEGDVIPVRGNHSGRAMSAHANDAMARLRVESQEVARFCAMLRELDMDDARRQTDGDVERGADNGVRRGRDDLYVCTVALDGRVNEFCRPLPVVNGPRNSQGDEDGRRVRRRMEEGPFGSDRGPQYPDGPYGGGSRSHYGDSRGVV